MIQRNTGMVRKNARWGEKADGHFGEIWEDPHSLAGRQRMKRVSRLSPGAMYWFILPAGRRWALTHQKEKKAQSSTTSTKSLSDWHSYQTLWKQLSVWCSNPKRNTVPTQNKVLFRSSKLHMGIFDGQPAVAHSWSKETEVPFIYGSPSSAWGFQGKRAWSLSHGDVT